MSSYSHNYYSIYFFLAAASETSDARRKEYTAVRKYRSWVARVAGAEDEQRVAGKLDQES